MSSLVGNVIITLLRMIFDLKCDLYLQLLNVR